MYYYNFITFSDACHNKECPFLHIDPESKIRDCPWYDRGFCRHGPSCRHRHVRRVLCLNFLAGFCPKGPDCADTHPKFEPPPIGGPDDPRGIGKKIVITCRYCGKPGHKVSNCAKVPREVREQHAHIWKIFLILNWFEPIQIENLFWTCLKTGFCYYENFFWRCPNWKTI